ESDIVAELVQGDSLTASGRVGPDDEITGDTWVRAVWDTTGDAGWIPAADLTEDFLLLSLPVVLAEDPTFAPMQALTTTSVLADRGCDDVPDSGLLLQTPDATVNMRFNSLDVSIDPETLVYLQAQPNAVLDIYVLAGAVDTGSEVIEAGTVMSYNVGPDALTDGRAIDEPMPYATAKVAPLELLAGLFDAELDIAPGTGDAPEVEVAEVTDEIFDPVEPTEEAESEETDSAPSLIAGILGSLAGDAPAPAEEEEVAPPEVDIEATASAIGDVAVEEAPLVPETDTDGETVAQLPTESAEVVEPVAADEVQPVTAQIATPPPIGDTNIATSPFAATLRERGVVRIGVNGSLPTFSEQIGDEYTGFEPNFARELVRRLFGDTVRIEWVQVSARQRSSALTDGTVDILIRNTSFAPERSTW
ncbi:MAG: transporter substrate-binding domain-containing protein, partial [Chloroflexota bacterium]